MFIAVHLSSGDVVSGVEVADSDTPYSVADDYACVRCQEQSTFCRGEERYDLFTHVEREMTASLGRTTHISTRQGVKKPSKGCVLTWAVTRRV